MSIYNVNYLCREVLRDPKFREALRTDAKKALARFDLTPKERTALENGDVGTLYRMGANSFLMGYLPRFEVLGLNLDLYSARMRAVDGMSQEH